MRAHRIGSNGSTGRTSQLTAETRLPQTALAAALMVALGIAAPGHAATFTVRNAADSGPGTLRQAVLDANANGGGHQNIKFALPAGSTITLTSGQIALTGPDITMQGPGQNALTISGNHQSRIFDVEAGSLTLSDMTLRDGLASGDGTNFYDQVGGAIRVGALPAPMTPAQFSARMAAAQRQGTVAANGSGRAHRSAGLRALQALSPSVVAGVPASNLTLDHVSLLDNRADAPMLSAGGAVFASGDVTLAVHNSLLNGNSTSWVGGAICALGGEDIYSLTGIGNFDIADTTITANHIDQNGAGPGAPGQGAGIIIYGPGGSIRRTVFRDNIINDAPADQPSEGVGGALNLGLFGGKPITITDSEISGNTIVLRPGVFSEGAGLYCVDYGYGTPLTITNTTISGNQSEHGAAIEAGCNLQLFNSTIAGNISPPNSVPNRGGGGDAVELVLAAGNFNATSTLIYNPDVARADLFLYEGANELGIVSNSLIFAPDPSTPPLPPDTIIGVDPLLGALANNGGPTRTQALLSGSPAIDAGSNPQGLTFDQRGAGFPRTLGEATDIGAFEVGRRPVSHGGH